MNVLKIVELNTEYKFAKQKLDNQYKELRSINDNIDMDELSMMSYEEIKGVRDLLRYCFNDNKVKNDIELLCETKKEERYPELLKAHYYPIINEIEFLTDNQKRQLDEFLERFYDGMVMVGCSAWYDLDKTIRESKDKIFEFLYDKGVLEKYYKLKCTCGSDECSTKYISEEDYNKFIKYHSITSEEIENMTESEEEEYHNRWESEGYFYTGCWNDGDVEVCSIEDLNNYVRFGGYKNITEPDKTLDEV